jgi:hypothetical protein
MTFLLLILAGIFKSLMDTINFHYDTSILTPIFNKWRNWFYIPDSSNNKYTWFPKSRILTWLISNPLVFITDAWHFFKCVFLFVYHLVYL